MKAHLEFPLIFEHGVVLGDINFNFWRFEGKIAAVSSWENETVAHYRSSADQNLDGFIVWTYVLYNFYPCRKFFYAKDTD